MHLSQSLKAVLFVASLVAATQIPQEDSPAGFHGTTELVDETDFVSYDAELSSGGIAARKVAPVNLYIYPGCGSTTTCPKDQIIDRKDKDKKKCIKCPKGKKPNKDQTMCEEEKSCKKDEVKDKNKCTKCPKGKKPNKGQTMCEEEEVKSCKKDEVKDKGKCTKCPKGKKPNKDQTTCEEEVKSCKKDEIKGKDKCTKCGKGEKPNKDQTMCEKEKADDKCAVCKKGKVNDPKDCKKCIKKKGKRDSEPESFGLYE